MVRTILAVIPAEAGIQKWKPATHFLWIPVPAFAGITKKKVDIARSATSGVFVLFNAELYAFQLVSVYEILG